MKHNFKIGNVIKDTYGNVLVITGFSRYEPMIKSEHLVPYDYVNWDIYGNKNASGAFRIEGYIDTRTCSCYYDHMFRGYTQEYPDEECELCNGTGDEPIYRQGLNDCVLLAETVNEYKKVKLQEKISKLQNRLDKL